MPQPKIKVTKNGPYLVSGDIPLDKEFIEPDKTGIPVRWGKGEKILTKSSYALCRCGATKNPPFCDGRHIEIKFDGTETTSHKTFLEQEETTSGPDLDLKDAENFCAVALFCHRGGDTWTLTEHSDDPKAKKLAIEEAGLCPSGRLVAYNKQTGQPIEPSFEPVISVVEDLVHKVSGPLWVKGKVPVESADGFVYEVRNRVTLCRCGHSKNKPFCDGSHCVVKNAPRGRAKKQK